MSNKISSMYYYIVITKYKHFAPWTWTLCDLYLTKYMYFLSSKVCTGHSFYNENWNLTWSIIKSTFSLFYRRVFGQSSKVRFPSFTEEFSFSNNILLNWGLIRNFLAEDCTIASLHPHQKNIINFFPHKVFHE